MIRAIDCNDGVFYLEYPLDDEKEILLNYLIKEYDIEDIEYKSMFNNGCNYVYRQIKVKKKDVIGIRECIIEINSYKNYKTREVKKLFTRHIEQIGLTREEKLIEMKSIINRIKFIMELELTESSDIEFLKKELGI